jgi:hypothetical protein
METGTMRGMPWRCPACRLPIQHLPLESTPRTGLHYRCHICRLELVYDAAAQKLVVAPMPDDESNQRVRETA